MPRSLHIFIPLLTTCAFLAPPTSHCEPVTSPKTATLTETFELTRALEPMSRGQLQASVDLEISHTDPLEFTFTVKNEDTRKIEFPVGPGNIRISFRNAVNTPLQTPPIDPPMDLPKGAPDPNEKKIEFYEIRQTGKPGKHFRKRTILLEPGEKTKILVRMGPDIMKAIDALLSMQDREAINFKLGVNVLFSIRSIEDREFFRRFATDKTMFFPYQIHRKEKAQE